ncbi:MAG TPA: carboxymuconolactone decarboxylase family protein [Acidimicrobiia bacterium]|nr:carboxymuconolactone decarboxylase family protein [Acidimicrobiia bacterium]
MVLITPPDLEEIDADVRADYETGRHEHRHFDALRRLLVRFPPALRAADGMYDLIMERGLLDRRLKEEIFVACSGVRGCGYAVAAHGGWLTANAGMTRAEVDGLAGGDPGGRSDPDRVLLAFARKVTAAPYRTVATDIDTLREAGFDERTIVEALTVVALSGWMNGYAASLGLDAGDSTGTAA